jgi:hypothetical protein
MQSLPWQAAATVVFTGCINNTKALAQGLCLYSKLLQCSMHSRKGLVPTKQE